MFAQIGDIAAWVSKKLSAVPSFLNTPLPRIVVLVFLLIYVSLKSFVSLNDNWHTFGSLLLLGFGFALIFRPLDKFSAWAGFFLILLLILSPFYWRLQGLDTDGFSITGVLPFNDANGYYAGAVNLLYGGQLSAFASRRPLFVVFLAALLFLFRQGLVASLLGMALIVSIVLLLLAIEVRKNFGAAPSAILVVAMIYCYTGKFDGKFLTEQLGIPLGMLALAFLLRSLRKRDFRFACFGIFILTLALNARAGAFFVLPLLILWGAAWHRAAPFSLKSLGILTVCALLGFSTNLLIFKTLAVPGSLPFANFGENLYGMVTGYRGWQSYYVDYPGMPTQAAFGISMKIFLNSPGLFAGAILKSYRDFFNPLRFFSFLYLPYRQIVPTAYILAFLTLVGLWKLALNRYSSFSRMMLLAFVGIVLSVPFAPPIDDGIRAMTATAPFLVLIAGLSFVSQEQMEFNATTLATTVQTESNGMIFISCIVVSLIVLGWVGVKSHPKVAGPELSCNAGESLLIIPVSQGSYVNVVPKKEQAVSIIPNLKYTDLQNNLAHFPNVSIRSAFEKVQAGQTIILGLNLAGYYQDSDLIWLIVPTDLVQNFNGINSFCAVQTHQPVLDQGGLYIERTVRNVFTSP